MISCSILNYWVTLKTICAHDPWPGTARMMQLTGSPKSQKTFVVTWAIWHVCLHPNIMANRIRWLAKSLWLRKSSSGLVKFRNVFVLCCTWKISVLILGVVLSLWKSLYTLKSFMRRSFLNSEKTLITSSVGTSWSSRHQHTASITNWRYGVEKVRASTWQEGSIENMLSVELWEMQDPFWSLT